MAPPNAPTNRRGMLSKNATTPIATGERVSSHTNQLWATFCMKSPELEIKAPSRSKRKLRCRRVRRGLISQSFRTRCRHHWSVNNQCSGKCAPIAKVRAERWLFRTFATRPKNDLRFDKRAEQANFAGNFGIR